MVLAAGLGDQPTRDSAARRAGFAAPALRAGAGHASCATAAIATGRVSPILGACSAMASRPGGRPRTVTEALCLAGRPVGGPLSCPARAPVRRLLITGGEIHVRTHTHHHTWRNSTGGAIGGP